MSLSSENSVSSLGSATSVSPGSSLYSLEENLLVEGLGESGQFTPSKASSTLMKLCRFNIFSKNYRITRSSMDSDSDDPRAILGSSYTRRRCSYFYHRYNYHQSPSLDDARKALGDNPRVGQGEGEDGRLSTVQAPLQQAREGDQGETLTEHIRRQSQVQVTESEATVIEYNDNEEEMILPEFNSVPLEVRTLKRLASIPVCQFVSI